VQLVAEHFQRLNGEIANLKACERLASQARPTHEIELDYVLEDI
jgi:hypothetical protein